MFTNWLKNCCLILIICPFNFRCEYFSPSYSHFMSNYTVFFNIIISLLSYKPFYFKTSTTNSSFNVLNPILCLGCLLLLWLDGPGLLTAAAVLAAWRLWSATILTIIFVCVIFFIFYNKWFLIFLMHFL